jgi:structural maintenance of chromosome 4
MIRSCTVKVHFKEIIDDGNEENPEGYRDVPDSKLVVSRTAFKDNSSYYEINGRRATFKDVAKLLRKKGVDLDHNRFLILQVKYSSVSLSKILTNGEYVTSNNRLCYN